MSGELRSAPRALAGSPGFKWSGAPGACPSFLLERGIRIISRRESEWSGFAYFPVISTYTAPAGHLCHGGEPRSWLNLQIPALDKAKPDRSAPPRPPCTHTWSSLGSVCTLTRKD